jgi:hypothetical protein
MTVRFAVVILLALCASVAGAAEALSPLAVSGPRPKPVATPAAETIEASISRGVEFLIKRQNPDGSWGSARRTKGLNIYAPVPGAHLAFRAAVTSLCVSALIESKDDNRQMVAAIERGEKWLFNNLADVRRPTAEALYNNWAHAFAIQALVRLHEYRSDMKDRRQGIRRLIEEQVGMLGRYECIDGGWAYYDFEAKTQKPSGSTMSFVTATVLVALREAEQLGIEIPKRLTDRAVASIHRQAKPDFSYCYGEYLKNRPMRPVNRPGGSLGRSQACNLALRLWGDERLSDEVLATWLDRLFARNLWLDIGRKRPVPHESWFQVAGYFFYYGHYYAGLAVDALPADQRGERQAHLAHILLKLQEKDGSWWDYPLYDYHQQYGTAYALLALVRCRH